MLYFLTKVLFTILFYILWRPKVVGAKNLKIRDGAIYISNHVKMTDPILIALISPRYIHFMAKSELFTNWIQRLFFKGYLAFPVNRKTTDMKSLNEATRLLNNGKAFGIFPEGTRSKTGELGEFEKGAAFLAVKSKAPVIPIYIDKEACGFFKRPRVFVGEHIVLTELEGPKTAMIEALTIEMKQAIEKLRDQSESMKATSK